MDYSQESVPASFQSISGIVNLVHRNCDVDTAAASRLQGITPIGLTAKNEPSYEQVLVTFSNNPDREEFLKRVPWHDRASSDRSPAFCACLRACSLWVVLNISFTAPLSDIDTAYHRERFASLKEEYLTFQNTLNLQMITKSSTTMHQQPTFEPSRTAPSRPQAAPPPPTLPFRSHGLAYPSGRLLFLRNVSTTTNKTAIRADMTAFLAERSSVDYVDWSKGHDTVSQSDYLGRYGGTPDMVEYRHISAWGRRSTNKRWPVCWRQVDSRATAKSSCLQESGRAFTGAACRKRSV
jgi:hypothetical protein